MKNLLSKKIVILAIVLSIIFMINGCKKEKTFFTEDEDKQGISLTEDKDEQGTSLTEDEDEQDTSLTEDKDESLPIAPREIGNIGNNEPNVILPVPDFFPMFEDITKCIFVGDDLSMEVSLDLDELKSAYEYIIKTAKYREVLPSDEITRIYLNVYTENEKYTVYLTSRAKILYGTYDDDNYIWYTVYWTSGTYLPVTKLFDIIYPACYNLNNPSEETPDITTRTLEKYRLE